ncbi:MAG: cell division protein FtsZ [Erysipelotrichaceae bacterium]|nr:cell division protein FtsZ [Erysipelotrichaceae bacterium]
MTNFNPVTKIKVFGIGGGGNNAVNRMVEAELAGVQFYVANTDKAVLDASICENRILLGYNTTHGLGAGGNPAVGKAAAEESREEIKAAMAGADMIFIAAGLGGGTGTGAAPIFAQCAREAGALTIGVVTKPFEFEGKKRMMQAISGLDELKMNVDSIIIVPNEKVNSYLGSLPIKQAFLEADNVLRQAVQTITDLVSYNAQINLDFADIRAVMAGKGAALIGVGQASSEEMTSKDPTEMAKEAAKNAITCPLLEANVQGAKNAIINVSGGDLLTIDIARSAVEYIKSVAGNDIDIYFGLVMNDALRDSIVVTIIATGFEESQQYDVIFGEDRYEKKEEDSITQPDDPSDFFNNRYN